mgnify:CR=1 FL=1
MQTKWKDFNILNDIIAFIDTDFDNNEEIVITAKCNEQYRGKYSDDYFSYNFLNTKNHFKLDRKNKFKMPGWSEFNYSKKIITLPSSGWCGPYPGEGYISFDQDGTANITTYTCKNLPACAGNCKEKDIEVLNSKWSSDVKN